jgi:hypothetical protein
MQFRVGKCGSCGATFKVPASFGGDKAKCKSCATGVVAIGPVEGDTPQQEEKLEEYKPSGKKSGGPSMMERLRAERAAAAGAPAVPAKKSPGKNASEEQAPAKQPASRKPSPRKPAVAKKAAAKPARPVRKGASDPDEPPAAGRARGASSRSSARRAGGTRSRRGADGDDEEDGGGPGRRGRRPQKKSPAPLIAGIVILIAAALGAWKMMGTDDPVNASGEGDQNVAGAEGTDAAGNQANDDPAADAEAQAADTQAEPEAPAAQPEKEPVKKAEPKIGPGMKITKSTPDEVVDPAWVDLTELTPCEKDPDCTNEQWAEIMGDIDVFADPFSGAAGGRAAMRFEKAGRFAVPAVVNVMLRVDFSTDEGRNNGDFMQKAMEKILRGKNYGWKYDWETEPNKTALFNKKVIRNYRKLWDKLSGRPDEWKRLTGEDVEEAPPEDTGLNEDDLDDLDDLDF